MTINYIHTALAGIVLTSVCFSVFANDPGPVLPVQPPRMSIADTAINHEEEFQLTITGAPGEYRIEVSYDLEEWNPWRVFGFDGDAATLSDPEGTDAKRRFYRLVAWLTADGFHLSGPIAKALVAELTGQFETRFTLMSVMSEPSAAAFDALGIDFNPTEGDLLDIDTVEGGPRDARVWTAVVGSLSILGQSIRDNYAPGATAQEIAEALNEDLTSGKLSGADANDNPITIRENGPEMPTLSAQDFLNAFNILQFDMEGLDNVAFVINPDGTISGAIPAEWDEFHWDSADWQ